MPRPVLEAIVAARPDLGITAVLEPGEVDAEFAGLFRRAGGTGLMVFAGSLSEAVLAAGRKPFQLADVMGAGETLRAARVPFFLYLTFGGPGETPERWRRACAISSSFARLHPVRHGFRIEPETGLHEIALARG